MVEPITACRACGSTDLTQFMDLGEQYVSDFRGDPSRPPKYPLEVVICGGCNLVQLRHTTPQPEMYHERYGFKSGVSDSIKDDLKDVVDHALRYKPNTVKRQLWLDIASNDGTLLSYVPENFHRFGVDPIKFLCDEARKLDIGLKIIPDYFTSEVAESLQYDPGRFDIITSISCFYDMPDPSQFVQDVKSVLESDGVWIIQQNYLLTTMQLGAVDNFCHEHLEYYTLFSLEHLLNRFGLEVNEVVLSTVNGGSIRTVVSHKGTFPVDKSVEKQRQIEAEYALDTLAPYSKFAEQVLVQRDKLKEVVMDFKNKGKTIAILAASTRGATLWQTAKIGPRFVDYAVERNPAKVGKWFSAIGIPIVSEEDAHELKPDVMLVGPWFFADAIIDREKAYLEAGGMLLFPLPEVKTICA